MEHATFENYCNLMHIEVPSKKKRTNPSEGLRCEKVDEGVAHIGTILRIHWQVEKVIAAFESRVVNLLQEASLRVPVWNVAEHHRRLWPCLFTLANREQASVFSVRASSTLHGKNCS